MRYEKNVETSSNVKEEIDQVFKRLNEIPNEDSGSKKSPIRSNNTSVLGKSSKPVNIN
ncbi:hypothetical protein MH109_15445 [Bacillus altitudinis]|uniref:hypothetical protein n=1 Tax=Bacillus altitudinis TaxID=293387 RepID=UPI0022822187|nr:hypothetical protein [Bacillus altitudinis]MCY7451656.1 hypothetical protein [Bacillus altitudinis]MCY7695764.1 hypothetical protein [Bacillus altitudinis]